MKHNVPVQSLIDHIKTAMDVDPWAKEMVEELLKEQNQRIWDLLIENERLSELLKEQEAVEPKVIRMNEFGDPVHACGKCGHSITESMNYCSWCGQMVKRE